MATNASHNQRRKTVRQFKRQFGKLWLYHFREHCDAIRKSMEGPLIGSMADFLPSNEGLVPAANVAAGAP